MRIFITSKNKYLSNDMKIFGTCSIPLIETYSIKTSCNKNKTQWVDGSWFMMISLHCASAKSFDHDMHSWDLGEIQFRDQDPPTNQVWCNCHPFRLGKCLFLQNKTCDAKYSASTNLMTKYCCVYLTKRRLPQR